MFIKLPDTALMRSNSFDLLDFKSFKTDLYDSNFVFAFVYNNSVSVMSLRPVIMSIAF